MENLTDKTAVHPKAAEDVRLTSRKTQKLHWTRWLCCARCSSGSRQTKTLAAKAAGGWGLR